MTVQLKVIFKESLQHCVSEKVRTTPCFFANAELLFAKTREGCLASCEIAPFGKRSQEAILPLSPKRDRTAEVMRIGHNPFCFFWRWGGWGCETKGREQGKKRSAHRLKSTHLGGTVCFLVFSPLVWRRMKNHSRRALAANNGALPPLPPLPPFLFPFPPLVPYPSLPSLLLSFSSSFLLPFPTVGRSYSLPPLPPLSLSLLVFPCLSPKRFICGFRRVGEILQKMK